MFDILCTLGADTAGMGYVLENDKEADSFSALQPNFLNQFSAPATLAFQVSFSPLNMILYDSLQ